mmetsp:Transcript_17601/g.27416  ORF Transcript_17601/g.27416 Transcript_17601/m.27416 type:complete len:486 (-) Transcript_17601:126-1583(-)
MTTLRSSLGTNIQAIGGEISNVRRTRSMAKSQAGVRDKKGRALGETKRRPALRAKVNSRHVANKRIINANYIGRITRSMTENKESEKNCEEFETATKSDLPVKFDCKDVGMRLFFANNSSLMKGTVQSFADICCRTTNGNCVDGLLNCWREHGEYQRISKQERLGAFRESEEVYKKCKGIPREIWLNLKNDYHDTNLSILTLYVNCDGKNIPACTTIFTVHSTNGGERNSCDLKLICTLPEYSGRGLGIYAVAILKDFTKNHRSKTPKSSFLWGSITHESYDFFFDEKLDFNEGWGDLTKIMSHELFPTSIDDGIKVHCLISASAKPGDYILSAISMEPPPEYFDKTAFRHKVAMHEIVPLYPVATRVKVLYPTINSDVHFDALVLDYNPNNTKPYVVQFDEGNAVESVVPMRIVGRSSSMASMKQIVKVAKMNEESKPMLGLTSKIITRRKSREKQVRVEMLPKIPYHELFAFAMDKEESSRIR